MLKEKLKQKEKAEVEVNRMIKKQVNLKAKAKLIVN